MGKSKPSLADSWLYGDILPPLQQACISARAYFDSEEDARLTFFAFLCAADHYAQQASLESPADEYFGRLPYAIPPPEVPRRSLSALFSEMMQSHFHGVSHIARKYGLHKLAASVVLAESARGHAAEALSLYAVLNGLDGVFGTAGEVIQHEKRKHRERSREGGKAGAETKKENVLPEHNKIRAEAEQYRKPGTEAHNVVGKLALRFGKSERQIRRILRKNKKTDT